MSAETLELTITEETSTTDVELTGDVWELYVETGVAGPPGAVVELPIPADQVEVDVLGTPTPLDDVLAGIGSSLVGIGAGLETLDGEVNAIDDRLVTVEEDYPDADIATLNKARNQIRAEMTARSRTEPLMQVCTEWGGDHDEGAYTTPVPAEFTDGFWIRSITTPLTLTGVVGPSDGDEIYSEIFTRTAEGIGVWDILEKAWLWIYDASSGTWRLHLFVEITFNGDTSETISLATSSVSSVGATSYPVVEFDPNLTHETAVWFKFDNGAGKWELILCRRIYYGTPDFTVDGRDWEILTRAVGTVVGSLETSIYPWAFGMGSGLVLVEEIEVKDDGPSGTTLAYPTAALAAAAGEGVAFDDGPGNTWTPGIEAKIVTPGPVGTPGADGIDGNTILYGTAAPTTEGVDGDFYIRTTTNYIYGPKANGTWPSGTSLVGAAGADGADGVISKMMVRPQVNDWWSQPHGGITTVALSANTMLYEPFWIPEDPTAIDGFAIEVTTLGTSGIVRLGLYLPHSTTRKPNTLVVADQIDSSSTGVKEVTVASTSVTPNSLVYIGVCAQVAGCTVRKVADGRMLGNLGIASSSSADPFKTAYASGFFQSGVSGSLPSTATPVASYSLTGQPLVALRRSA